MFGKALASLEPAPVCPARLLDDLVRPKQHDRRDREPEGLGRLEVNDQLDARRLLHLLYSFIMVSFPIEIWKQPYIPDTGTASFELKIEPIV